MKGSQIIGELLRWFAFIVPATNSPALERYAAAAANLLSEGNVATLGFPSPFPGLNERYRDVSPTDFNQRRKR